MRLIFLAVGALALAHPLLGASVSYFLQLDITADGRFWGQAQLSIPIKPNQRELIFRLYPNNFGPFLRVEKIWAQGTELGWDSVDPTVVVVSLPEDLGQTASVRISFSGELPNELLGYGIFAQTPSTMTLSQFYPILAARTEEWLVYPAFPFGDNLVAEAADYTLNINGPAGFVPVGSGEEKLTEGKWQIVGTDLRELGLVLVRGYECLTALWGNVLLRVFFPQELRPSAMQALRVAEEALSVYTERLGAFPYPDLDMVIVPLAGAGGVEYPRLILIGQSYALDPQADLFAEIVAHELAHQWWYGEVGTDQVREPWVDEGLATFTSALYFEAQGKLAEKVARWQGCYARGRRLNPTATVGSPLWDFPAGQGYGGHAYCGAALFLQEVRGLLGDESFFSVLRRFREAFRFNLAGGSDLLRLFLEEGGERLVPVVERYFGAQTGKI